MKDLQFERPSPARFRSIRFQIARVVRRQSLTDAIATADLETELWLAERDEANAARMLATTARFAEGQPA